MTSKEFSMIGSILDRAEALGLVDAVSATVLRDSLSSAYARSCAFDLVPENVRLKLLEASARNLEVA
jgi:hypothetical protein